MNAWCLNECVRREKAERCAPALAHAGGRRSRRARLRSDRSERRTSCRAWVWRSNASDATSILVRATPAALGKTDVQGLLGRPGRRVGGAWKRFLAPGEARSCRGDHRLPRIGEGRASPVGRRDERSSSRDGGHAAFRPVQSRPPDLGEAGPCGNGEAVRKALKFAISGRQSGICRATSSASGGD